MQKESCVKCGKETGVYTLTLLYHCPKCNTNICDSCLPPDCKKGKLFKKYLCPQCGEKMEYLDRV